MKISIHVSHSQSRTRRAVEPPGSLSAGVTERMKWWEGCGRPRRCSGSQASPDYYESRPTERNFLICTEPFLKSASFPCESKIALLVVRVMGRMAGATCRHRHSRARAMSPSPARDSRQSRQQGPGPWAGRGYMTVRPEAPQGRAGSPGAHGRGSLDLLPFAASSFFILF